MTRSDPENASTLSPEEAFAVLGDETRLQILHVLGDADDPLSFSGLFDRCEYDDTSNFDYHLDRLAGHFVRKTDDGYDVTQRGRRVVQAVLSGALTDDVAIERSETGASCPICDAPVEVRYRRERIELYCTACGGSRRGGSPTTQWAGETVSDIVGFLDVPPAGVRDRSPEAALRAAEVWTVAETQALARGVCPRCSGPVERSIRACAAHDAGDGHCEECGQQFGATLRVTCGNCVLEQDSVLAKHLLADPDVMAFLIEHGVDPVAPGGYHLSAVDETVRSTDPIEVGFTVAGDDAVLSLTVDEECSVVDVTEHDA